jgi:succinate dehydrogenase/fumarate reductase flavoprotein subunit
MDEYIRGLLVGNQKILVKVVKLREPVQQQIGRDMHYCIHLYQNNIKEGSNFLNEWFAVDLVLNQSKEVTGVIAFSIESGEVAYLKSQATVMATGGAGRIYSSTTNALINTGDGLGMALRAGFPAQDMEMWQFHPNWNLWSRLSGYRRLPRRGRLPNKC